MMKYLNFAAAVLMFASAAFLFPTIVRAAIHPPKTPPLPEKSKKWEFAGAITLALGVLLATAIHNHFK